MKSNLSIQFQNFLKCGLTGWCIEILFTAYDSFKHKDFTLRGVTSIWMFPIYGCAFLLAPISRLLKKKPAWFRGLTYMSLIFSTEYITGTLLTRHHMCPWDYSNSKWNINKVIRLDYAPYWFGTGLLFERILNTKKPH